MTGKERAQILRQLEEVKQIANVLQHVDHTGLQLVVANAISLIGIALLDIFIVLDKMNPVIQCDDETAP